MNRIETYERDGLVFDVLDRGPLDGEVVVLLHGFPQLNTSYNAVAQRLNEAGYRTLAPNQRGYSPGARPPGRKAYRTGELVDDVIALVDEAGSERVHLVGHDWGAAVAWAVAMTHPERLHTLTAISVPHIGAYVKAMPRGQGLRSWYMVMFNVPGLAERLLADRSRARRFLRRGAGMPESAFEDFWRDFGDGAALRGGLGWYRALPFNDPRLFSIKVSTPTTYVWSDGDTALSRAGAKLCERFVTGPYRFELIPGRSHWLLDEEPEEIARIVLERLRSTPAPASAGDKAAQA